MAAIAADLAKDSVQSLLKAIVASIGKEIALAWGFKDDLKDLQKKLTRLDYLLSGAHESKNPVLRDWVKKVADVAYRAEDVVDEYAYEVLKRKLALRDMAAMQPLLRFKTRVRFFCFSRSSNPVLLRFRMAHKVRSLKESIAEVYADAQVLGIKPVEVAAPPSSSTDHPTETEMALQWHREQVDNYEELVGRDDIKAQIIEQLHQASNSSKRLTVIGIHGMAGVGKTKLCRSVFETTEVKEYFKERIWICVSHDFDSQKLLKRMIEQLGGEASTISDTEAIKRKLHEKLEGKKYLLVLDDVWDTFEKAWEPLRNCLQDTGELMGNTILVTSRRKDVLANLKAHGSAPTRPMDDPDIHELPRLLETNSWSLFEQKVGNDSLDSSYKEELARKMLTKCGGVPLAIKTLAGLLRSKNELHQWKEIEASSIWEEDAITLPVSIKLSFKYLPSVALKKCFVYCAIFQEDEIIEKDRLIQLWMAQGFLQHPDDEMEKVGEDYFHVLLNNSLFQDAEFDHLRQVISCKMHDAVHDLARMLSRNDVTQEQQHSSLSKFGDVGSMFEHSGKLRTVSVSFIPIERENFTMKTVNHLRVLSLVSVDLKELPDSIGELKHLRYLDISGNWIESLPDGFTRLYNLQTFRAFPCPHSLELPTLPKGFSKLVKLRHIANLGELPFMDIPVGLGMLTCLRTLPTIRATAGRGGRLSELQFLSKLEGRLSIQGLERVEIEEAKKANLGKKENIKDLGLCWGGNNCNKAMEVAEALQPHSNLVSLVIDNYKAKSLPKWVTRMIGYDGSPFSNLVNLQMVRFHGLEHLAISLKNLVALKELDIRWSYSAITPPQHLECLVSLQILKVKYCWEMENLVADMTALVNLQEVAISYCTNMTCLPIGISNLPRLKALKLGPFHPELDVFPFPTDNHGNYEDQNLNGCSKLSQTTTSIMMIKQGTIIKKRFESLVKLSLYGDQMEKVKNLPNQIQHLNQLRSLRIEMFNGLEALPEWLGSLTSLRDLKLCGLPNVKCLPSEAAVGRLSRLKSLCISHCPLLKEACDKKTGTEWSKIQHIPDLTIRGSHHRICR